MIAKTFEVRDSGTFLPVLAVCMVTDNESDRYLVARSGFASTYREQAKYVVLWRMSSGGTASADAFDFGTTRTMRVAAKYIQENFHELPTGSVVCVETLLGERAEPKKSERFDG